MFSPKSHDACLFLFLIDIYIPEKSPSVAVKTSNVLEDRHELRVVFTAMLSLLSLWLRLFFVVVVVVLVSAGNEKKSKFHSQKDLFSTLQRAAEWE